MIGIGDREIRLPQKRGSAGSRLQYGRGGALLMSLYRCRFFRLLDRTLDAFLIQGLACENDAEAIAMARHMSANSEADRFELWKDERCVHIEPQTT